MSSRDSDTRNLLEKAEQEVDVAKETEKVKDKAKGQSSEDLDLREKELDNEKDEVEIGDVKLAVIDSEDVAVETKEESTNEKTGLISSDSSSSDSEGNEVRGQVPVKTESDMDYRIDNLTKR